ncbi:MAG: hypothetical protein WC661_10245 [Opitutaceae bacterium]|jgi:hypothetical protein
MSSSLAQANDNSANTQQGPATTVSGNNSAYVESGGLFMRGQNQFVGDGGIGLKGNNNSLVFQSLDGDVAKASIDAVKGIAASSLKMGYDSIDSALTKGYDAIGDGYMLANKVVDTATLFADRAVKTQNDVISAETAATKAAYDFAASQAQPGNAMTSTAIKYILWSVVGFGLLMILLLRPRKPAKA